jgi:hypothetical protein
MKQTSKRTKLQLRTNTLRALTLRETLLVAAGKTWDGGSRGWGGSGGGGGVAPVRTVATTKC